MTQCEKILKYMQTHKRGITPLVAMEKFGIMRFVSDMGEVVAFDRIADARAVRIDFVSGEFVHLRIVRMRRPGQVEEEFVFRKAYVDVLAAVRIGDLRDQLESVEVHVAGQRYMQRDVRRDIHDQTVVFAADA